MRRRPADGRGEAAGQRQHGDRTARRGAEDAPERREGGIVERGREARRRAASRPRDRRPGASAWTSATRPSALTSDPTVITTWPPCAVDRAADERRDQARGQQAERESAHGERQRPAALGRDQRHDQHRRIEDRAPGDDLRDAEHGHGAPRTMTGPRTRATENVTKRRHGRVRAHSRRVMLRECGRSVSTHRSINASRATSNDGLPLDRPPSHG